MLVLLLRFSWRLVCVFTFVGNMSLMLVWVQVQSLKTNYECKSLFICSSWQATRAETWFSRRVVLKQRRCFTHWAQLTETFNFPASWSFCSLKNTKFVENPFLLIFSELSSDLVWAEVEQLSQLVKFLHPQSNFTAWCDVQGHQESAGRGNDELNPSVQRDGSRKWWCSSTM